MTNAIAAAPRQRHSDHYRARRQQVLDTLSRARGQYRRAELFLDRHEIEQRDPFTQRIVLLRRSNKERRQALETARRDAIRQQQLSGPSFLGDREGALIEAPAVVWRSIKELVSASQPVTDSSSRAEIEDYRAELGLRIRTVKALLRALEEQDQGLALRLAQFDEQAG